MQPGAYDPPRGALDEPAAVDQDRELGAGLDAVVELLDRVPEVAHLEHVAGDRVGAGELGAPSAGLLGQAERERHPGTIDQLVGDDRRDQLPAQAVRCDLVGVAVAQRRREVALQVRARNGSSGRSESSSSL